MCDSPCEEVVEAAGGLGLKDGCSFPRNRKSFGTGGCLAVQGRAVLPALLLTHHGGQLPANQLPSRMNKLDLVLGNGGGRAEAGCDMVSGYIWRLIY